MKHFLMAGAALATITALSPALAQEASTAPAAAPVTDEQPGDIIVTAQKRSERLQEVPIAVSVVGGDLIASQGKSSIEGAQYLVPSLNFLKSGTTLNQSIFLRGVGTATFSIAGEPSVSTVVDGVVYSRAGEAFSDLVDIDRMEVLRGPQGTLFGKNASAGVINIVSKQPGKDFGGYVEAGYFTRSEYRLRGAVDLPLSADILTRFTGFYDNYDGNIRNLAYGGKHVNGFEHYGGRFQMVATPSDAVKLTFIADYHKNNDDCCAEVIGTGPLTATGAPSTSLAFSVLPTSKGDKTREINQDLITSTKETGYGFSGQADVELGGLTVTSITAYRNYKNTEIRDGDWLPAAYIGFNQLHDFGPQTGNTFSQELRLTSPGGQFVDYVLGAYFSRAESERIFQRNDIVCTSAVSPAPTTLTPCTSPLANPSTFPTGIADFGSVFKNLALFGQGTVNISDRFRVIGGLRYTVDQLNVFHSRNTTLAGPGIQPSFPVTSTGTGEPATVFRGKATNSNLSGKAAVQYDLSRGVTAYASYTRGYKGPAFNVFYNLTATGTNEIAPETSDAYEGGLKTTLLGGQLVVNIDGFYAKYHNFQANNPDLVAGVVVTRFTNAGIVSTRGGEVDVIWRPTRDFSVTGGGAYTDAHVDRFFQAPGAPATAIVPAGTPLGFAPKWKGNLGADYRYRTGGAIDFFAGAQGSYQSKQLSLFAPDATQRLLGTIKGYGLVNLNAGITSANDVWRLTFQVRNLFDQSFAAAITNGGPGGSYRYQIPRDADRYFGVTGRLNF
jgi:iron complex outermembrane receptor protein